MSGPKQPELSDRMRRYFDAWVNRPTLLADFTDREYFYKFVKACLRGRNYLRCGAWLSGLLHKQGKHAEHEIRHASKFLDWVTEFSATAFPDPMIEMKDPELVRHCLRQEIHPDGTKRYSEREIDDFLSAHFGEP